MQLSNDQIKAVSEWMEEHGVDGHLIRKFEGDFIKPKKPYFHVWDGIKWVKKLHD